MNKFRVYRVYNEQDRIEGRLESSTLEALAPGEVTIRAEYSSVNYKDALASTGAGRIIRKFPLIAGIDVAGRVYSSTDRRFSKGDAVLVTGYDLGVAHDGGYAGFVRVPAEWVVPLPPGMSTWQAMALGTAGFTVALCLHRLECNGQTPDLGPFIVTGATGGVGMLAIDVLAARGYEVVAVTGKPDQSPILKTLGCSEIMDRHSIRSEGPPLDKGLWGGAIDNVGGHVLAWLTRTVKPWGNIVAVGLAGGSELHTTVMPFILRGISLLGVTSAGCPTALRQQLWKRLATDLKPRHLERIVTRVAALEDLPAIFADMLAGKTVGRTVVKISI
ncbi:MAG: oxidoreductase [Gammaproteobacteria bacterium]